MATVVIKQMENDIEFIEKWKEEKGLIRQADAARILGLERSDITYRIKTEKIKVYRVKNTPFLSFHDVLLMRDEKKEY